MIGDLRHIRAFLAAARIGNFTRAAADLHVSQSAFSVQIRQLEETLGVTLFDRGKRRVTLTSAGREVIVPLERVLVDLESILGLTQQLTGMRRGIVTLAVLPSVAEQFLPEAVLQFKQLYPDIVVKIQDVVGGKLIDAVKSGEADFGIGSRFERDREIRITPLLTDRLCAFVSRSYPLAHEGPITVKELMSYPLILTGRDSSVREILERALKRERLIPTIAFETNYMSTAISLARVGLGVAILPESAAKADRSSTVYSTPIIRPTLSRKIEILQRRDRSLSPAAAKMVELLRGLSADDQKAGYRRTSLSSIVPKK